MSAAADSPPLTIVHVTAPAPVGGLESVVTALARGHAAVGHHPHVVSVFNLDEDAYALADGVAGVATHVVRVPPRRYGRERSAVANILRDTGAQVVHTHGYRPDVVDAAAARALGIPAVSTVHGFIGGSRKGRLFEWLQVRALRRFDAVVAVSRPQVERLARGGVPERRVCLIPNAWAPLTPPLDRATARSRLGLPPEARVAGWVGRLSREKAPDLFLDALALFGNDAPLGAIVGDGPLGEDLRSRALSLGMEQRVRWCGRVGAAAPLMPAFDVFVLSSRTEGTPIALLEAIAAGVPVVATRVGGVPDVVSDTEALLVPPNDPRALADAIRATLADSQASASRAAAARDRLAREFAEGPWLSRYEQLYREVVAARPGR